MTTKEEVLRLAEAAGLLRSSRHMAMQCLGFITYFEGWEFQITKLIELSKQAEREECITQIQLLQCPYKQPSDRHIWDMGVIDSIRAIRNREIIEPIK